MTVSAILPSSVNVELNMIFRPTAEAEAAFGYGGADAARAGDSGNGGTATEERFVYLHVLPEGKAREEAHKKHTKEDARFAARGSGDLQKALDKPVPDDTGSDY